MTQGAAARKCHPKPPERQDVLEALPREPLHAHIRPGDAAWRIRIWGHVSGHAQPSLPIQGNSDGLEGRESQVRGVAVHMMSVFHHDLCPGPEPRGDGHPLQQAKPSQAVRKVRDSTVGQACLP